MAGALPVLVSTPACAVETVRVQRGRVLMGTTCRMEAYGAIQAETAAALDAALNRIAEIEALLSTWRRDTELARLNRAAFRGTTPVSPELAGFLRRVLDLAEATDGAFDPSVGALIDAWDLRGDGRVPGVDELQRARRSVGYRQVQLDAGDPSVRFLSEELWLDSGASGKGYALQQAAEVLRGRGVRSALLDFGGQLLAMGSPPGEEAWSVAVADPGDRHGPALILALRDVSVATSSQWERGRQVDGRRIGHILDPRSGEPVEWEGSATVVARDALVADALATGLFVLGPGPGLAWAQGRAGPGVAYLSRTADGSALSLEANPEFSQWLSVRRKDIQVRTPRHGGGT